MTIKVNRGLRIGSRINNSTSGSILFVNSDLKITQDNSNLFWDDTNNRLGIGIASPARELHIHASNFTDIQITNDITGSTSSDGVTLSMTNNDFYLNNKEIGNFLFFTNNTERIRIDSTGNLGIGTTNPTNKLHIDSGATAVSVVFEDDFVNNRYKFTTGGNNLDSFLDVNSDSTREAHVRAISGSLTADLTAGFGRIGFTFTGANFLIRNSGNNILTVSQNAPANSIFIASSGNVGIGNSAPSFPLEIGSGSGTQTLKINAVTGKVIVTTTGTGEAGLYLEDASQSWRIQKKNNEDNLTIRDNTAGLNVMTFEIGSGNVGIGTTSPGYKLHLSGDNVNMILDGSGAPGTPITELIIKRGSQEYSLRTGINGANDFDIYDKANSASRLYIKNGGNVGIGTSSPETKLEVLSTSQPQFQITFNSANKVAFSRSGGDFRIKVSDGTGTLQDRMTFDELGNIGIGITSPGAKLEIAGQVKITGGVPGLGKVLTSDSVGLATWETLTDGNGIYNGSGTVPNGTVVSIPNNFVLQGNDGNTLQLNTTGNVDVTSNMSIDFRYNSGTNFLAKITAFKNTGGGGNMGFFVSKNATSYSGLPDMHISRNGTVSIGLDNPDPAAKLEIQSTTQGFLPPQMTEVQRDAISSPPGGLIIYNTTTNTLNVFTAGGGGWRNANT